MNALTSNLGTRPLKRCLFFFLEVWLRLDSCRRWAYRGEAHLRLCDCSSEAGDFSAVPPFEAHPQSDFPRVRLG